jgi:hypothetical protein
LWPKRPPRGGRFSSAACLSKVLDFRLEIAVPNVFFFDRALQSATHSIELASKTIDPLETKLTDARFANVKLRERLSDGLRPLSSQLEAIGHHRRPHPPLGKRRDAQKLAAEAPMIVRSKNVKINIASSL